MSVDNDERTPLLRNSSQPQQTRTHARKSYHIYGSSLGILFLFAIFINWYRTLLPTPLSDAQARQNDDFAGIHAYNEYLSRFVAPHSANTRENGVMRDWFATLVTDFQKDATDRGVPMDVIGYDPSRDIISHEWFTTNEQWYVESRNVMVRINGTAGKDDAVLVNAHFDSVPTSNGVTDDGMGIVTILELIRYFIEHPPRHTIIFLLNNFEEGGLLGVQSFVNHPWYKNVRVFYNLEGSGAGGRALIFRCTNLNAVKKFANSKAQLKHGNALGNDVFKYQLIKSDTDYSVFVKDGVPGVDIAFYTPRSFYHTPRDDLAHTTPEALQYMGQVALNAVREVANSDDLLLTKKEEESFVYYDILGRWMFAYSMTTYQVTNILALLLVPAIAFLLAIRNSQSSALTVVKQKVVLTIQGFIAVLAALVVSIIFIGVAVAAMTKINPSMSYGDVYGAALYTFVAGFLGLQVSQLILPSKLKATLAQTDATWYGLITFWWLLVVLSTYTSQFGIAGLYFAIYLLVFSSIALLVHNSISAQQKLRSAVIYFSQIIVPALLLLEIEFLSMDSLRHATADGTPEAAVYVFLAFPLVLLTLHFVPWVHVAGNQRKITVGSTIAFIFLFTICSALQPFNGSWSPNKIVFRQEYNYGDAFATVFLSTATGLQATLKKTISPQEYNTMKCEPFRTFLTRCSYQTELVPKYGSNTTLNEFVLSEVEKTCNGDICTASGSYSSKNSLMCRVLFKENNAQNAKLQDKDINRENITALVSYVNQYEEQVKFAFDYAKDAPPQIEVGCFYDEWTKLEIPAFSALRDNLPENAILLIRGQGLTYVNYKNVTL